MNKSTHVLWKMFFTCCILGLAFSVIGMATHGQEYMQIVCKFVVSASFCSVLLITLYAIWKKL